MPRPSRCSRRPWRSAAACSPRTTPTPPSGRQLGECLHSQGKYVQAQPLYQKALDISRRLLTDDNPATAHGYTNLAINLKAQGKYAQAQPLLEKALEIRHHLLTDDHPQIAQSYSYVAICLDARGSTPRPSPSSRRRSRSATGCSPMTIPILPSATTIWQRTSTRRVSIQAQDQWLCGQESGCSEAADRFHRSGARRSDRIGAARLVRCSGPAWSAEGGVATIGGRLGSWLTR